MDDRSGQAVERETGEGRRRDRAFCRILVREIRADAVSEVDHCVASRHVGPQAVAGALGCIGVTARPAGRQVAHLHRHVMGATRLGGMG